MNGRCYQQRLTKYSFLCIFDLVYVDFWPSESCPIQAPFVRISLYNIFFMTSVEIRRIFILVGLPTDNKNEYLCNIMAFLLFFFHLKNKTCVLS